jgi:hypothetical protein
MAGMKMLELDPINTCASSTGHNVGIVAITPAPTARAMTPAATSPRFDRIRSTRAPAGVWAMIPATPPIARALPTSSSFHPYFAR